MRRSHPTRDLHDASEAERPSASVAPTDRPRGDGRSTLLDAQPDEGVCRGGKLAAGRRWQSRTQREDCRDATTQRNVPDERSVLMLRIVTSDRNAVTSPAKRRSQMGLVNIMNRKFRCYQSTPIEISISCVGVLSQVK